MTKKQKAQMFLIVFEVEERRIESLFKKSFLEGLLTKMEAAPGFLLPGRRLYDPREVTWQKNGVTMKLMAKYEPNKNPSYALVIISGLTPVFTMMTPSVFTDDLIKAAVKLFVELTI